MSNAEIMKNYGKNRRGLIIKSNDGEGVIDTLNKANLDGWELREFKTGLPGEQFAFYRSDEVIVVSPRSNQHVMHISSVLPYVYDLNFQAANSLLKEFRDVLISNCIECNITASEAEI